MNILYNCLSSISGGAVSYLCHLTPLLVEEFERSAENHRLHILAHDSQRSLLGVPPGVQCTWLKGERPAGYQRVVWEHCNISRVARQANADVVFAPYQICPRVKKLRQILMICNMEPFCYDKYSYSLGTLLRNRLLRWQSSRALRAADRVIAVSAFAREQLEVGLCIPTERTRRIYNGRNTEFSPCGEAEEDRSLLRAIGVEGEFMLTCGSLLPYRRCEDVIAAFNLSARSLNADVKLVIAGSGNDRRYAETIRRAISQSPYSDRIVAVGHVPKEAMITLYRRSLLCVIATEIEACPTIAIEAMTSGCVILSSDRPPLPEMFGDSSVEYQARDIAALAAKIDLCVNDAALRSEMKKRALQRSQSFSWEKCAKDTYAALVEWPEG